MSQIVIDEIVLDVIDKGLAELGESPKRAIWYCLEKDFKFERRKLPEKLEAFEEALQKLFGLGYIFLESLFLKHLHNATGEDLQGYKTFADCVRSLRMKTEAVEPQAMSPLLLEPNL